MLIIYNEKITSQLFRGYENLEKEKLNYFYCN